MSGSSRRELVVLGTASQVPTRERNHNGYVLRWDGEAVLFDPGEGTQRQLILAGIAPSSIRRICLTHLHGDHCLGLPGVLHRLAAAGVPPVPVHFPAEVADQFAHLVAATGGGPLPVDPWPSVDGSVVDTPGYRLTARGLDHRVPTLGWRLEEPPRRRMLPDRLAAHGVFGPDVGRLQREGSLRVDDEVVTLDQVSVVRPGQVFACVMDTRECAAAVHLAAGADLALFESTFLEVDRLLADAYGHLTAAGAARLAAQAGVRRLVLSHYSQRYSDRGAAAFAAEAAPIHPDVVAVDDLDRVPVPR